MALAMLNCAGSMKPITPNCRSQLSAQDVKFIASVFAPNLSMKDSMTELLADESARDAILESDRLFQALLEVRAPLPVSPRLYFYVLTRRVLDQFDRDVADYIASLLAE